MMSDFSERGPLTPRTARFPQRLVVKVGSALLAPGGVPDPSRFTQLASQIGALRRSDRQVTLVSSGAVACGLRAMGLHGMPERIVDKQAAAAVGQPVLMSRWADAFGALETGVAQVLLTRDDFANRARFLNARHTLEALLDRGVVPVVNENDSVAFDEIRMGDNDTLSAHVAALVSADLLVILSGVAGLLDAEGRVVPRVDDPAAAAALVRAEKSATGVGGFATKLDAARIAASHGVPTRVADGRLPGVLERVVSGDAPGTLFAGGAEPVARSRKRWIATAAGVRGTVITDAGARRAIVERGASLLSKGITGVEGRFGMGDGVDLRDPEGVVYARGLASYPAEDVRKVVGLGSGAMAAALGYSYTDAIVHRDDLIVLG